MKKISIVVPCYNEEENVVPMGSELDKVMQQYVHQYDYEIVFIDNCSTDNTRPLLIEMCNKNKNVKAIFNAKNFGPMNSPFYGLCQATGDCAILFCCDFQDPLEMIPKMIAEWENGYSIVCCRKTSSRENPIMRFLRTIYYKVIKKMSAIEQIEHFTGFGLYDRSFLDILKNLNDPTPFLRGIVAELGFKRKDLEYEQQKRRAGKTHLNFYTLYDTAMLSFTSYTKAGLRVATFAGAMFSCISLLIAFVYLVMKLIFWDRFSAGMAPILIGVFVLGSVQIFFIGLLGEYIMSINSRVMKRPLVVEERRINFEDIETVKNSDEELIYNHKEDKDE